MKNVFRILMFVGAFGLGALADRWVLSPKDSSTTIDSRSFTDADFIDAVAPSVAVVRDGAGDGISLASFEEFAETRQPAASENAAQVGPSRKVSREQVRTLIEERFPGLSHEAVAGWTDAYEDVPLNELHLLLEQRKGLPSILPRKSFLSNVPSEIGELRPTPVGTGGRSVSAATVIQQNLLHAATPGFRRRRIITQLDSFANTADSANGLRQSDVFDLQPGKVHRSQQPFHMAIADHPELMFQLEPGNLLTRNGTFVRLPDGRLGIQNKDGAAALLSQITIPADAGAIRVSTSGAVHFEDAGGQLQAAGKLKLAIVTGLADFQSANGVFFTTSTEPSMIPNSDLTPVVTNALEASNVDIEHEWKLADHYERLIGQ
ncbi:MAG: hypothetical protein ABGZ53_13775 [Fuerstiella sp.]